MADRSKYKYPKIQTYLDASTEAKFAALCKQNNRSRSAMAAIIIYNTVKDVKL